MKLIIIVARIIEKQRTCNSSDFTMESNSNQISLHISARIIFQNSTSVFMFSLYVFIHYIETKQSHSDSSDSR